jgi:CRP-like cAMP-binding protein
MPRIADPNGNHLIAALAPSDRQRWQPWLEWVDMPLGKVLYESGTTMGWVYFPVTAIVSLVYVTERGASAELAVVGNEGLVGVSLIMGGGSTPSRGVVQSAGQGFRMNAASLKAQFNGSMAVQLLLLRYTQSLIMQMSQAAVCNRYHSVDQQLSRRLLLSMDRISGSELHMTHESIANLLGVRREGVTAAALRLQRAGAIRYARGCIDVLDRDVLEQRACECYGVVKRECDRLSPAAMALHDAPVRRVEPVRGQFVVNGAAALLPAYARSSVQAYRGSAVREMATHP